MNIDGNELQKILTTAVNARLNVLIEGSHGTGKTSIVSLVAKELGMAMKYYSTSTLDPFVDLVGLPVPVKDAAGNHTLLYHRPQDISDAEIIFFDELNRAQPKVLNAVLEIIQFGTINGDPLPRLRCVIAACNPASRDYNVVELDAALVDRFHMHIEFEPGPDADWFCGRFDRELGAALYDWWSLDLDNKQQGMISPRTLEHIGMLLEQGLDPARVLNYKQKMPFRQLIKRTKKPETVLDIKDFIGNPAKYSTIVEENPDIAVRFAHLLTRMKPVQMAKVRDITLALPAELVASMKADCPFVFKQSAKAIAKSSGKEEAKAFEELLEEKAGTGNAGKTNKKRTRAA